MLRAHMCVVLVADVASSYAAMPRVGRRRHPTTRQQAEVLLRYLQLPRSSDQRDSRLLQVCGEPSAFMSASCECLSLGYPAAHAEYLSSHAGHRSSTDEQIMPQLQTLSRPCLPYVADPTILHSTAKVARTVTTLSDTAPAIVSSKNLGALLQMISAG